MEIELPFISRFGFYQSTPFKATIFEGAQRTLVLKPKPLPWGIAELHTNPRVSKDITGQVYSLGRAVSAAPLPFEDPPPLRLPHLGSRVEGKGKTEK